MRSDSQSQPLSELDIALIQLLRQDGRMTTRDLSKHLDVSEVTVRKRLRRLRENSILSIVGQVEPRKVGYKYDVIISLHVDAKHLEEVAECLVKFPEVRFVALTSGAYDLLCEALFKDTDDLLDFLLRKLSAFEGIISTNTTFSLKVLKRSDEWLAIETEQTR